MNWFEQHVGQRARAWLAPGLTLVLMLLVAGGGALAMRQQHATVDRLVGVQTPKLLAVIDLEQQVKQTQSWSYRLLAWTTANYSADQTTKLAKSINESLVKLAQTAKGLKRWPGMGADEIKIVNRLEVSVPRFSSAISEVVDMADTDQAVASTMMIRSEAPFSTLMNDVDALRKFQAAETRAASEDTTTVYRRSLALGGALVLACTLVSVLAIRNNVGMVNVIAEQNATLEKRVAERTAQLRQKTNDIQAMLQNMPQGVMTVLPGGLIHPEYSAYMETIFETKEIGGRNLMELVFTRSSLGANDLSQVDAAVGSCIGEDLMNYAFNSHLLVTDFNITLPNGTVKSLSLSWSPIADESDTVEKLMLCVRDVTELKRLAGEAGAQKRELEIIGEILAVSQEKFQDFIESAYKFITENEEIIRKAPEKDMEAIGLLFRNMHTIKGNARTYGLLNMTNVVHETEQEYDDLRKNDEKVWDQDLLLKQLAMVHASIDEYQKTNDVKLGRKGPGRRGSVERFLMVEKDQVARAMALIEAVNDQDLNDMRKALADVDRTLRLIGTDKIESVLAGIIDAMPSLAHELGKEAPKVTIADNGIVVRTQAIGLLKNVFTHLFRNSMDHGLENAETRQAAGKHPVGHIQLEAGLADGTLTLKLRDDGRGLALGRIRAKAVENGVIDANDTPAPEVVANLIFASGFSTAEAVTEVSGRGVGMDAVRGFLLKEGGDVQIVFTDDKAGADQRAFELQITLPGKFATQA